MPVAKDSNNSIENEQMITDILLFANHPDPQIRGNISMIIGTFLKSVFTQYGGSFKNFEAEIAKTKTHGSVSLENLVKLLLEVKEKPLVLKHFRNCQIIRKRLIDAF